MKLFLKGERCLTEKCAVERRSYPPGEHGRGRIKQSEYLLQLREKQKARRIYGVHEAQFHRYYETALRIRGMTGLVLLQLLERRLDNVVYRLGYASSRAQARNLVTHGHFNVNGRRTDVPSMILTPGDVIDVRPGSARRAYFRDLKAADESVTVPLWLSRDLSTLGGKMVKLPERTEIDAKLNEQLIVEYYSR
jgi:small subunit ribosomal protein S4